ncbi:sugar-binding protein [Actinomadura darangshiensis]|uniref:Sugar-binding protein n=1 Tax=Actinomadura darangshiensis TaxID=705336 RepID=A0A4R5BY19_9ACTN|nr:RHS repeat-associated core domain-containing protein [Actinomadura darangshiensis]TDD89284.1 sugar-binding protein [Actinomadura darangshiensis]
MEDAVNAGRKVSGRTRRRTLVLGSRRAILLAAGAMAVVMPAGLLSVPSALAEPPASGPPKVATHERPVPGHDLKVRPRRTEPPKPGPAAKVTWPSPGSAEVSVPSGPTGKAKSSRGAGAAASRAGKLPVEVLPPGRTLDAATPAAGKVRIRVLGQQTTRSLGVDGLAFTVARTDAAAPGRVGVRLDYSKFAQAFGGAYGARLRLVQLPSCALTTPTMRECRTGKPVTASNNGAAKTLTADIEAVPAAGSGSRAAAGENGTLLVATAGSEGSQGDYKATSLEASATWSAGGNTGDFTWSYPMRVPPVPGGMNPKVEISYSSGSVDGKTANTNGQPSWVGEGFDLWPGYIERRFKSCEDDGAPKDEWGNSPGDQCWGYDNATVTWNGKGGELIKASDGTWRMKGDDGTKFEKLTSSSVGNGDEDGEYWKVTTTDGTQYFFGLNRLPEWTKGKPETQSTWTVPVFGDDADEPCHKSTFKESWCQQAYRWNLDYVVDSSGNAINYTYGQEINHYGRNLKAEDETSYVRGGYLKTISYGLRKDALFAKAPAQVTFTTSERCVPDTGFDCDPSKIGDKPDYWWDVPWDLHCDSGQECKDTHGSLAPTFWSRKRLTEVTTQILKSDGSGYRPVDSWSLTHKWGLADVERDLLLTDIQHTGHAADGGTTILPKVTFHPIQMDNRLDEVGDDILGYVRYRVGAIDDESGGRIDINYSDSDCSLSDRPTPETNTTRCMPVIWTPPGREKPITDWFHKYVVTSVFQTDRTGLSPDMVTKYQYVGDAAWHFDDDNGLTKDKNKTWSQWRGYGHVRTFTGDQADPATQSDAYYLRGMDGDRKTKDGGTKSVTVSDGEGGTYTDHDALAGFTLKTVQYTEPGGNVHAKTVNTPWRVQTASQTRSGSTITANVVSAASSHTWTAKDGGGWTETKTETGFTASGPGIGRVTSVSDLGDVTTPADDKCTLTTYVDNVGSWMLSYPSRVESLSVACATTPTRPDNVVTDARTYYDNGGLGDAPSKGDITKVENLADYDDGAPRYVTQATTTYDTFSRVTQVKDALGQPTTTAYIDPQGLTTKVTTTTPPAKPEVASSALTTVKELDPAWGQPTRIIDANNLKSDLAYDGLGRLHKVWLPDRSKATGQNPNYQFDYQVAEGQIVAVTTQGLTAAGAQRLAKIELLDGWLRPRQTQVPGPDGRLISDTFYDNRGQAVTTYAPYTAEEPPKAELFGIDAPGKIETQNRTEYDGLGRKTAERVTSHNGNQPEQELWRTTYSYGGGNRVSVTPPEGGTPSAQITNARGQVIERRQYKAATPAGEFDATTYAYTPAGEIASVTDPSGNTYTTTYDLRGRKTKTTDPDKGAATYAYNDLNQLTSTTDARGKKVFAEYDGLGRKTATRKDATDGPLLTSFTYDTAVRGKGKPATATRHHDGAAYTSQARVYDYLGRPQVTGITIPEEQGALAGSYGFNTIYNLDGTLKYNGLPAAGGLPAENTETGYDTWLRPTSLHSASGTYVGSKTTYTPTGKLQRLELGGTIGKRVYETFSYEYGTQRLATAQTLREGRTEFDRNAAYHYTDSGAITSITDSTTAGIDNQCFTYDHLQRLTQAWTQGTTDACATEPADSLIGGPAPYWQTLTYDTAGNRKAETQHGIAGVADTIRTYTYNPAGQGNRLNQVTSAGPTGQRTDTYAYDATGNTTQRVIDAGPSNTGQTLEWDTEGELAKVTENGNDATFIYDTGGNRLIRKDPAGSTLYLPGGTELRVLSGSTTVTGTRYYGFAGQTVVMRTSDGTVTYLTADHAGSAQIAINAATQASTIRRFTPFGGIRGMDDDATWPNDKGFVGGTQDPTGLTHLGAREYDPGTGRFISVDPLMDQADPQQMNGYTYANNSPVTNADPDGDMCRRTRDGMECFNGDGVDRRPNNKGGYDVYDGHGTRVASSGGGINSRTARRVGAWNTIPVPQSIDIVRFREKFWNYFYQFANPGGYRYAPAVQATDIEAALHACRDMGECVHSMFYLNLNKAWVDLNGGIGILFSGGRGRRGRPGVRAVAGRRMLAKAVRGLGGCSSFVPETDVLMADGTHKSIQDVKVGDKVLATDPETGETRAQPVLGTITSKGDKKLVQITVDSDAPALVPTSGRAAEQGSAKTFGKSAKRGLVVATDTHPFWVTGDINTWVKAADLKPGMWLRTSAGTYVQITATKHWTTYHQRVHNLTVANSHTYYAEAGDRPVLVHNCGGYFKGHASTCSCEGRSGYDITLESSAHAGEATGSAGNLTRHSLQRLAQRGVSEEQAQATLAREPFSYHHDDQWKTGYYDPESKIFVAKTIDGNINTVMTGVDQNYINRLRGVR